MNRRSEYFSQSPERLFGPLFTAVQSSRLFSDSKVFVDAVPRTSPADILASYQRLQPKSREELLAFVRAHFALPDMAGLANSPGRAVEVEDYISGLWDVLARSPDSEQQGASLIALPHPYTVPGGRFREVYYWDSYFTMLGLVADGRLDMAESMVKNFAHLIDTMGFVPNGNRSYYATRSQPPLFFRMVTLLAESRADEGVYLQYLPAMRREYAFWMQGVERLGGQSGSAYRRLVRCRNRLLNRYWDDACTPRPESYIEDLEVAAVAGAEEATLFRNLRAGCESGWDFSSRWLRSPTELASIRTTEVVPVDLNAIMCEFERTLSYAAKVAGHPDWIDFHHCYEQRLAALKQYFFNAEAGFFCDLLLPDFRPSPVLSLAGLYPLFFGLADDEQADSVAQRTHSDFLRPGGWVTTLQPSGEQWDSPNGWAPLQWVVFSALRRYGYTEAAKEGASRWVALNREAYQQSGRLLEKYNVDRPGEPVEGGEYHNQEGFGWTNAILIQLMRELA